MIHGVQVDSHVMHCLALLHDPSAGHVPPVGNLDRVGASKAVVHGDQRIERVPQVEDGVAR